MRNRRLLSIIISCCALGLAWVSYVGTRGIAQGEPKYVGSQVCATCHSDMSKEWALTPHRPTLFNKDPAMQGCESCHGPGGDHVENVDPAAIVRFRKLKPEQITTICLKCHNTEHVTLWKSSIHARAKLTCVNCHDPHSLDGPTLVRNIQNGKLNLEGLTRSIQQVQLESNSAAVGSKEKESAEDRLLKLREQEQNLRTQIRGFETEYKKVAEPYLCYNCHKTQQVQVNMATHHPIPENKMLCSSCHNPHGGMLGMLREESTNETCFRCHAEKEGPFTFEHPPVMEDCTICHNPHGSPSNNLLVQREPFVCLKCHAGPHSRPVRGIPDTPSTGVPALGSAATIPQYYNQCTDCHATVHGSDEHAALHY